MPGCSIPGCERKSHLHGWCRAHYERWLKHGDPLAGGTPRGHSAGSPARFFAEIVMTYHGDECLLWPFDGGSDGYGRIRRGGGKRVVSRLVCEAVHGPAPTPRHEAAHSCGKGNKGCVSQRHLSWKTPEANAADKLAHGTHNRGENHPLAKLSAKDVAVIRSRRGKVAQQRVAEQFGISQTTVGAIQRGTLWASLPEEPA